MDKTPVAGVVDFTEGELTHYINQGDSLKIIRKESKDSFNGVTQLNKKEDFIKVYLKPMMLLSHELSSPECTVLFYALQYLDFTTGMLMESKIQTLQRSTMAKDLLQTERNIDRLMNALVSHEILMRGVCGKNTFFLVNPFIFMRGKMVNKTLVSMFAKTKYAKIFEFNYNLILTNNDIAMPEIEEVRLIDENEE